MSRTPAAEAARLRIQYPEWTIERAPDGWRAKHPLRQRHPHGPLSVGVAAPSVAVLETMITGFEDGSRPPRARARGAGARVP